MNWLSILRWFAFAGATAPLLVISWKALRNPRSHGFYRFFAWEAILGLFVLNAPVWFHDPFSWNQIVSWMLLAASLIPLALGIYSLRSAGKPDRNRGADPELLGIERTTRLVTDGVYRYIRHPLYCSLFLLNWGICSKRPNVLTILLSIFATIMLIATAKADEIECTRFFGVQYQEYMKKTRMFVPYIF
ncbi:MAG TPA: methyltransferase [Anaerolineales bacterium]|nr:methyltransferase [Anaerolineales bacterium]